MPNFPGSLDDDVSLFLAVNNARTRLQTGINESELNIEVVTTSGFPNQGFITILSNPDDITEAEAIRYDGISETTFSGVERGAGGTPVFAHFTQDNVDLTAMAEHHNELKDAIIELEKIVGISGSHNFVPKDAQGNAIVSGTLTTQNLLDAGWITASGSLVVCGPGFFKGDLDVAVDLVVSGTATFGVVPVAVAPEIQHVTNDNTVQVTSTSFVDTNCETGPLPTGHNLVFFNSTGGGGDSGSGSGSANLRAQFAAVTIGEAQDTIPTANNNPWGGVNLAGFKMVTGDGVNTVKLQGDMDTGSSSMKISAQSIMTIPFAEMGLVEGTDYWFANGSDSDTNISTSNVVLTTLNATLPDAGDYIFFGSAEGEHQYDFRADYWANGVQWSTTLERSQASGDRRNFPFVRLITGLDAGANTFEVRASRYTTSSARFRRGRICIVRAASFDNVVGFRQNDNQATSSSTFAKVTPTEINYTAAQNETILVFANPTAFVSTLTGDPMVTYKLVDETAAVDLVSEVSPARFRETDDRIPTYLYSKLDDVFGPKTFSLSIREPEATGSSVEHETVNMLVWSMTLATESIVDTPVTVIDRNVITTHEITADEVIATSVLTAVDGAVVTFGQATVTGSLGVGDDVTVGGNVTVGGTSDFTGDATFEQQATFEAFPGDPIDTVISGSTITTDDVFADSVYADTTVKVGTETVGGGSGIISAFQDTEQSTTSTSFVDVNCETGPLVSTGEYLVLYCANHGQSTTAGFSQMVLDFGGTTIANSLDDFNHSPTSSVIHNRGGQLTGVYALTGDGTSKLKFQLRNENNSDLVAAGAMAIVAIPTDNFTVDTNYFLDQQNGDAAEISNISDTFVSVLDSTFTITEPGDYIYISSVESNPDSTTAGHLRVRWLLDAGQISPEWELEGTATSDEAWASFAHMEIINLTAGDHDFAVQIRNQLGGYADGRRGRHILLKKSLFDQVVETNDTTGASTSAGTFTNFTGLNTTYTPNQTEEVLVVAFSNLSSRDDDEQGGVQIYNDTSSSAFRVDSGRAEHDTGANNDHLPLFMFHKEELTGLVAVDYKVQYRNTATTPTATIDLGQNANQTGGQENGGSSLFVWSMTLSTAPVIPLTQVIITDDRVYGNQIDAETGMTVSGQPVSTGTINTPYFDDRYVNEDGDTMSGNLDMNGNNIYNAGVVSMQDNTPVVTTSGLLWFDTDAPGHGSHGSAQLPGGLIAATLTTSSGVSVPDSVFQPNIPWDTGDIDKGGWYDSAQPQRLTVPSGVQYAQFFTTIHFEAENSSNRRQIQIYRNGNTSDVVAQDDQQSILNASYSPSLRAETPVLTVSGGDYFQVAADLNTNSGPLDILSDTSSFGAIASDTRGIPGVNTVNLLQGDIDLVAGSGITLTSNSQSNQIEIKLDQEISDLQIWSPDQPPASGTSFDSEWGDGAGLNGWTDWDPAGSLTTSTLPIPGALRLKSVNTIAAVAGLIRPAPTNNFTIFTKLWVMTNTVEDFREFGIVLSEDLLGNPNTANFAVISLPFHEDGADPHGYYFGLATQHFSDYNSFDRNLTFAGVQYPANDPVYLKVHVDVTTRIVTVAASRDGLIWGQEITDDYSGDLTNITEMGYWISNNTTAGALIVQSDFFRVVENIDHSAPLHGDFLTVSGVPQAIVVATGTQGGGSGDGNITDINFQEGPSVTVTGVGPIDVITESNVLTITGTEGITGINTQFGPEVTITGAGIIDVITTANVVTVSGDGGGNLTDINAQTGPSITITGTAGIGVITVGNVITIDGTEVQGSGGSGVTISGCYTHYQSSASATWSINHNLASTPVNYIVLDNANTEVIPNTFTVDDSNNVTITFVAPQAGRADIFPCVSGTPGIGITEGTATVSGCYSHVQTVSTGTWTVDHNLDTEVVNYVVLDNSGSQVQPDDFTVVNGNQITLDFVSPRVGIANIFACVDDDVTFNGGVFSNIVAVTGTFLNGLTVGTGTTYITGSGIDTPELKIAGQTPSFGGGALEYIGSFTTAGTFIAADLPSGYRTFELHMVDFENTGGVSENLQYRMKTVDSPSYTTSMDSESATTAVRSNNSSLGDSAADELNNGSYQTASRVFLHPISDSTYRLGIDADQKWNGVMKIHQMGNASNYASLTWEAGYFANDDRYCQAHGSSTRYEKSRLTGLRFGMNAGGTFEGTVYLYGYPE